MERRPQRGFLAAAFLALLALFLTDRAQAQAGTNVALGKAVTLSSTDTAGPFCVDGNTASSYCRTNVSGSGGIANQWVDVDLGADFPIDQIRLFNQAGPGCCSANNRWMLVVAGDSSLPRPANPAAVYAQPRYYQYVYSNTANGTLGGNSGVNGGNTAGATWTTLTIPTGLRKAAWLRVFQLDNSATSGNGLLGFSEIQVRQGLPFQRYLVNGDFETPVFVPNVAIIYGATVANGAVSGWSTTDQSNSFEFWTTVFQGISAFGGRQFAELNAFTSGTLSQSVCVFPGESFTWSVAHHKRVQGVSAMTPDVARLSIDGADIAQFTDNEQANSNAGHTCTLLAGAAAASATCATALTNGFNSDAAGWGYWRGNWSNTNASAKKITFEIGAASSASGNISFGNLVDRFAVAGLATAVDFDVAQASGDETVPSSQLPHLSLSGILASASTVDVTFSGTAVLGQHYQTSSGTTTVTVAIPAGTYDGTAATAISLAPYVQILADGPVHSPPDRLVMTLGNLGTGLKLGDGAACANAKNPAQYTILDVRPQLSVQKSTPTTAIPAPGGTVSYSLTVSNTGNVDGAGTLVSDPLPSGISAFSWTCTAAGGAACPNASGSGAISETLATFPAGGFVTYAITATVSVTTPAVLINNASASLANASCTPSNSPSPCSDTVAISTPPSTPVVRIDKGTTTASLTAGGSATYVVTVRNVGNVAAGGSVLTDPLPAGLTVFSWTCTALNGAVCPTASGSGAISQTIATFPAGSSLTYTIQAAVSGSPPASVTNSASVQPPAGGLCAPAGTPPPCSASITLGASPRVHITKTTPDTSIPPSGSISYTVVVNNSGSVAANGTVVNDDIPFGLTGFSWTCAGTGGAVCPNASGSGAIAETIATLPAGGTVTYTITATTPANPPSLVTNIATASPPGGVCAPASTAPPCTAAAAISPLPVVRIQKSASTTALTPGAGLTYTVVVSNVSDEAANGTTVADAIPAGIAAFASWTCSGSGGAVCPNASGSGAINQTVATFPGGSELVYTISATVAAAPPGTVTNTASTTPGGNGVCFPGNTPPPCTASVALNRPPSVRVQKSTTATLVTPGSSLSYTVTVTNTGLSSAAGTQINDPVPLGISTFTWTCAASGGAVCPNASGTGGIGETVATFPAGGVLTYTVTATASANPPAAISNTARATPPAGGNCSPGGTLPPCAASATVPTAPRISLTKTAGAATVPPGGTLTYTVTLSNAGSALANGTTVSDPIPAGIASQTWTCAASGGAACPNASGSGAISETVATLPAGGSLVYTVTATVSASPPNPTTNTASATPPSGGLCAPANTAPPCTATVSLNTSPLLAVTKTDGQASYTPGGSGSYTITVTNMGGSNAANAGITDTLPAGVTIAATPTCATTGTATCGTLTGTTGGSSVSLSGGSIGAGAGSAIIVTVPVNFAAAMTADPLVNTATATATGATSASGTDSNTLQPLTALGVVKTDGSTTYTPGGTATYTITVTNAGPSNARDVDLSDTFPAGVTLTATPTCSATGTATCGSITGASGAGAFTANNGLIAAGAGNSLVYSVPVAFAANLTTSPLVNTATATDPADATPNSGSDSDTPLAGVNLALVKTATPSASYLPGQPLSYTLQLTNNGPSASGGISLNDTVPASVTVASWTCTASGAGADCDSGAAGTGASGTGNAIALGAIVLGPGESVSVAISGTVALSSTGAIVNTATAAPPAGAGCTTPPCSVSSSVTNSDSGTAELSLVKSASPNAFAVGQAATYTLQLSNSGTSSTTGTITLSDPLPANVTTTATPSGSGWNCAASTTTTVTCTTTAVLPPGANAPPVTVPVTIGAGAASPLANTASASGGGDASCPAATHCQGTTSTPVNSPHLELTKLLQGNLVVGQQSLYVISVANSGQAAALAGTVSDTIPTGLTIGTLPAGCSAAGQTVTCTLTAGLAAGNSVNYSIPVTPQASTAGQSLTNSASVSGGGDASCPSAAHCSGTTTNTVGAPQLSVVKTATPASFVVGQPASYTIQVTNTGSAATTAVTTVTDTVPTGLTIGTLPAGCSAAGQVVTCTIAAGLATGAPVSFVIPVTPQASLSGLSVTNNATASGGGDTSCPAGSATLPAHCTGSVTTSVGAAQLSITKSASGANFVVGVPASYTLTVTNTGSVATTAAASVSDTIPAGLVIGSLPVDCSAAAQVVTCTIAAGLATGSPLSFVIPVTPSASANGQVMTNSASVSGGGDPTCPGATHCSSSTTTPVQAPQLSLAKSASAANFVVGVPASYTLTVTNSGTAATTAVATLSDTVPSALTVGTVPAGCSAAGQVVTCTIAAGLAAGASENFVIPVTPAASASGTTVTNSASVSGGGDTTCPAAAHCSSSTSTPVEAPQLTLVKSASASNFVVGVAASYTLQVTNTGTAATTAAATVSDTVPGGLTLGTMPAGCTAAGQVVTCTVAAGLASGAQVSFVIPVTATASASGTAVSNSASVSGGGDASCPAAAHCNSSTTTPVDAPQLSLVKAASAANFVVGVPASYTLSVTNTGSAATTAPTSISDTVAASLSLGSMPAGCVASGQVVTCTIAPGLAAGASVSFVIPVTPAAGASGTVIANSATVSGGGDATCPAAARCSSSTTTPVDAPELTLVKSASAASFVVGVQASYTLQVTNSGSAATTTAATVSDTLAASLTLGTLPAGCTAAGQVVSCTVAAGLSTGASVSFVIPVTPTAAAAGTSIANSASLSGGDATCPAAAHCTSSTTTPVGAPQLDLLKSASAAVFVVGVPATYTLQVTNSGAAATTAAATVSDTVPAALTLGAMPAGCSASGQTVTCTIAAGLAAGAQVSFVLPVTPTAAASGTSVTNTASVSGGGDSGCPAAAHCSSSTQTPVDAPALSIAKSASAANFVVGVPASYTLTVTNTGSAPTTAAATVSDTVPAALTLGSMPSGCTATGQVVTCTVAAGLAAGTPVNFVIPVTPTAAASGTALSNTASVSGGGDASCPGAARCSSTVVTPVNASQLTIAKTASAANFVVGVPASYTLTATNTGSAATTAAASISDTVATSLSLGAMPAGCTAAGQSVTCSIAAGLAAGASVSFVIPVTATASAAGTSVANTATVSGGGDATCPAAAHCSSTITVPVDAPQLSIAKTASTGNFTVGTAASYTLSVSNNGSAATTAVATVSDSVPAGLSLGTLPAGCTAAGQVVSCTVAAGLAAGASVDFVIPVTPLPASAGTTLVNTATISGGGGDCAPCSGSATVAVGGQADLSLFKSDGGTTATPGGTVQYTLTVSNAGPSVAVNASISDTLPTGLTFVSASGPGWTCAESAGVVTCTLASLASGAGSDVVLVLGIPAAYAGPDPITNTANVTSDTPDPQSGNNSGTDTTPLGAATADLSITKTGPASVAPGNSLSYTLVVRNNGPATATAVSVLDPTPAGLNFVSASAPCASGFPCVLGDLANGATVTLTVTYAVPLSFTGPMPIVNTASLSSGTTDPTPANNSSAATTGVAIVRVVPLLSPAVLVLLGLLLLALGATAAARTVQPRGR